MPDTPATPAATIGFYFASSLGKMPEWLQRAALGRRMFPIGELAIEALTAADLVVLDRKALEHVIVAPLHGAGPCELCAAAYAALHPVARQPGSSHV